MTRTTTSPPPLPLPLPLPLPPQGADLSAAWPALVGIVGLWWVVLYFHLTPAMFAALLIYGGTRALAARLERARPGLRHAQACGLLLLVAGLGGLGSLGVERAAEATLPCCSRWRLRLSSCARCCRRG